MPSKERLDVLVVRHGLASSRERAKALIVAGEILVNGKPVDKPGAFFVDESVKITSQAAPLPYVSRGGLKLEKALASFGLRLEGRVCLDIGASTGGFTDCMLQAGAARVYAIDVGSDQLAQSLRDNPRVVCLEKTNVRHLKPGDLPELAEFASIDVSFISLEKILAPVRDLLSPQAALVCLIKPQFEAGPEQVGKHGVVRSPQVHAEVIERVIACARELGLRPRGLDFSPIKGPEGNIEYLLWLEKGSTTLDEPGEVTSVDEPGEAAGEPAGAGETAGAALDPRAVVEAAHREL